jgi:hypothetical protein
VQLGLISTVGTSNKALMATTTRKIRVPNPLNQLPLLMVTNEQNLKVRRLTDIATFVGKMVMWNLNVLRRWKLYKQK